MMSLKGYNAHSQVGGRFLPSEETQVVTTDPAGILLTPEGYLRLQQELEHLTTVKRPEIADRIRESQQHGEFSDDNNELDEVKFEQAMVENRIADLKALFGNAAVLEPEQVPTDFADVGSVVALEDLQHGDEFEVRLVSSVEADPGNDLISNESPMGQALVGRKPGDEFFFDAPEGRLRYKIVRIRR
jgi:transcription elongation factor GreA